MRHVFTKAIRWGIATKNPADGLELGPRSPKRSQVTLDQVEAVKAIANERMRAAIDPAVSIGQRRGDLLTLKWEHVTDAGVYIEQSKGGARVLIEHSPDLDAVLARLKALKPDIPREFLIRKRNGRSGSATAADIPRTVSRQSGSDCNRSTRRPGAAALPFMICGQ